MTKSKNYKNRLFSLAGTRPLSVAEIRLLSAVEMSRTILPLKSLVALLRVEWCGFFAGRRFVIYDELTSSIEYHKSKIEIVFTILFLIRYRSKDC